MSRKVAILGTGLIGGSIGLGLKAAAPGTVVTGYDPDPLTAEAAVRSGALDRAEPDPGAAVTGADTVVLAGPVDALEHLAAAIAPAVTPDAVVTDVGSAKAAAVAAGESALGPRFVGGHPMAGSERHGIDAASADLFRDAWWILTPTRATLPDAYARVAEMVGLLGAKPVAVSPSKHDSLVARLSHVPQLTASALVDLAAGAGDREALLGLAAGGFRDVTRIAASNPDLWVTILRSNKASILDALSTLNRKLSVVAESIKRDQWDEVRDWLAGARNNRLELFARPDLSGEPAGLSLPVTDRPGVLAEVTTAAGRLGANIEDLRIVHSTEGGHGRLELVVTGEGPADRLADALTKMGYRVERAAIVDP
ncbi:MAG TPA: prephenate dehydrogenase/arogenate dehydrogenase family protein [Actinomycetota bacterium]|nr:prephenate dehydrogenase/arogenate dehydrogenase family protein [Actinomycetota bacterium]